MVLPTFAKGLLGLGCGALLLACSLGEPDEESPNAGSSGSPPNAESATQPAPVPAPPPDPLPSGLNLPSPSPPSAAPSATPTPPSATPPAGRTIYATANGQLLSFTSGAPSKVVTRPLDGLADGTQIVALSFGTGNLTAIGTTSQLFTIDTPTSTATPVSNFAFAEPLDGVAFGFSFDPVSKLARVVSNTGQNIRIGADAVVTNVDDTLVFMAGDTNAARVPYVVATAYTPGGKAFAIDTRANVLVELIDSYSGQMRTVGPLGVDPGDVAAFDISGADVFAALRVGNTTGLYTIDLATGAAKLAGPIGTNVAISGLAIAP